MTLSLHRTSASALLTLLSSPSPDETTGEAVAEAYLADGYARVEVETGPGQIRVVAMRDGARVETVLAREGGACLARTVRALRPGEAAAPGRRIRAVATDFVAPGAHGERRPQPLAADRGAEGGTDV